MKKTELSRRMQAVADMAEPCRVAADIGCDHAFVSIYLAKQGKAEHVIASDVRTGPVEIARKNIKASGMDDRIELRMGDGLSTLAPGEADVILIAGMGGMLMIELLTKGETVAAACKQLVLQPQSDIEHVRRYIDAKGYLLVREHMFIDAGKYYNVMDVRIPHGKTPEYAGRINETEGTYEESGLSGMTQKNGWKDRQTTETEEQRLSFKFGGDLLRRKDETLKAYLKKQQEVYSRLLHELSTKQTETADVRRHEIENELADICLAFTIYYNAK